MSLKIFKRSSFIAMERLSSGFVAPAVQACRLNPGSQRPVVVQGWECVCWGIIIRSGFEGDAMPRQRP